MNQLKARLGENSTWIGAAVLAAVGAKYGPESSAQVSELLAIALALVGTVRGDKAPE